MKKSVSFFLAASFALFALTSCNKNEDPKPEPKPDQDSLVLKGDITENMELKAGATYELKGGVYIKSGVTLTIKEGTKIVAEDKSKAGSAGFLLVEQGGKIDAQGTAAKPIIFTCEVEKLGSWGGIHVCGKAPLNVSGATSEIGDKPYGGSAADDNSGTLKYVIVKYGGAQITQEKEHNGFSFYGVGSGTTLMYLQAYKCGDDGFEWFGGTVNANYLISTYSGDDQFDWTEGWSGKGQFWVAIVGKGDLVSSEDPRGIEADSQKDNPGAAPVSNPTLSNITIVGSEASQQGVMLRRGTYAKIYNIILKNFDKKPLIEVRNTESVKAINDGKLLVDYVVADYADTVANKYSKDVTPADLVMDSKKFEKSTNYFKEKITITGYVGSKSGGKDMSADAYFMKTDYIGAVSASSDWTSGWAIALD